ncbi:response regulator transcription factor [candidate division KSB1 bacterium]|nr:response regulator transcription factor [candidate division KSB1 bacterium]
MNETKKQIKILIADDHPLFLKGLHEIISEESGWLVVAQAKDGGQALEMIIEQSPEIAILDINMPQKDGLEVAKYVQENNLPVSIIILTMYDDELIFNRAASFGVKGFILKESAVDDIVDGIENVIVGKTFVSSRLTNRFLQGTKNKKLLQNIHRFKLTRMEQKVIKLIADNYTTKAIAEELFISPKTVEHHRSNICKKLNLSGKNALLRFVLENKELLQRILPEK